MHFAWCEGLKAGDGLSEIGTVFEGEDLHSDSLDKSDLKEDIKSDKTQIENKDDNQSEK